MKRIIKDYRSITEEQIKLIAEHYPEGIDSENLISFVNAKGEYVKALEVRTDDTIYLFKISAEMIAKIDDFTDDDYSFEGFSDFKDEEVGGGVGKDDDDDDVDDAEDVPDTDDGDDDEDF
jgi:DNA-directed RNA polymerase subunit delta